jgi:hypothetical protein
MVPRQVQGLIRSRLRSYPAVALVGPRQSGKTTLARAFAGHYFDLEQESERLRLDLQWERLERRRDLIILDEAQSWPEIFPRLRGAIDQNRGRAKRFLLLGSIAPSLMIQVSESLAGRLSLVELTPFLFGELRTRPGPRAALWMKGGYPDGGVLEKGRYPRWQLDYLSLLAQRDLPNWGLPAAPETTQRLLRMLAATHGQIWNASQIGQSLGLSYHTVNSYLDYLVGSFLIRRLPPYRPNVKKRLTKSPRVYWRDSGLLHALLNVTDEDALLAQPWVGASWEGFVIEQLIGTLNSRGTPFEAFYFRTSDQHELDLVVETEAEVWAVEIKLTSSPGPGDMARLDKVAAMIGATRRYLVSRTSRSEGDDTRASCNLRWLLEHLPPNKTG